MASASRNGSMLLTRAAARQPFASSMAVRSFTTSRFALDDFVRRNPLVGNYNPPKPAQPKAGETPPVSTERPRASRPPHPSRAPASSAEVPPNADMPPPPPRAFRGATVEPEIPTEIPQQAAYDVNTPLDLKQILNSAYNKYALQTGMGSKASATENVRASPVTGKTVFLEGRFGVMKNANPTIGFKVLDRMVKEQKIRKLFNMQKFHERPGLKRKRLRMERWRGRFKGGFKAAASRVLELKKQGW